MHDQICEHRVICEEIGATHVAPAGVERLHHRRIPARSGSRRGRHRRRSSRSDLVPIQKRSHDAEALLRDLGKQRRVGAGSSGIHSADHGLVVEVRRGGHRDDPGRRKRPARVPLVNS
jgi:hypothetical protein